MKDNSYECGRMHASAEQWVKERLCNVMTPAQPLPKQSSGAELHRSDHIGWDIIEGTLHMKSKNPKSPCLGVEMLRCALAADAVCL